MVSQLFCIGTLVVVASEKEGGGSSSSAGFHVVLQVQSAIILLRGDLGDARDEANCSRSSQHLSRVQPDNVLRTRNPSLADTRCYAAYNRPDSIDAKVTQFKVARPLRNFETCHDDRGRGTQN